MLDKIDPKKREIKYGNKKIIYEIHRENNKYKGITIDIIDTNEQMLSAEFLSLNQSEYVHDIVSNFNPNSSSHSLDVDEVYLKLPEECYVIDNDMRELGSTYNLRGNYLGNIVFNTHDGKKIACFISQKIPNRYYKFLDLTGTNILACTEWDLNYEYLGIEEHMSEHEEYKRRLDEMLSILDFTTVLEGESEEKLIDFNGNGVTEEGTKKFEIFKSNILDLLNKGYELFQPQDKPKLESNHDNDEINR